MKRIDEKISAFVKRYVKPVSTEEMEAACQRNLRRLTATVEAMKEAQARAEEEPIEKLKPFECLVLKAAYLLRGDGYGLTILAKVNEMSEKDANLGSLYVALSRMEARGLVQMRLSDPIPERGRRPRQLVTVTAKGERALAHAREYREAASDFLRRSI
jgi:PadR family transcriptional regulator PadR